MRATVTQAKETRHRFRKERPDPGSKTGRIYTRLIENVGRGVTFEDIEPRSDRRGAILGRLSYDYLLDIRPVERVGKRSKYALVGVIDGKTYVDLLINPHLAPTFAVSA